MESAELLALAEISLTNGRKKRELRAKIAESTGSGRIVSVRIKQQEVEICIGGKLLRGYPRKNGSYDTNRLVLKKNGGSPIPLRMQDIISVDFL